MASKKIISVFGATGKQGGSVVRAFLNDSKLKSGWAVRGVSRNAASDSSKELKAQGVEMVSADFNDKSALVHAMEESSAVFAATNYWEKMDMKLEIQQGKNLADAAKEAGVNHFVWSSLLNINKLTNGKLPNVYHFDSKAMVEDYIRELGIPATFFMPGFFMSNIPGGMMRQVPPNNAWTFALPVPETAPIPMFDSEDDTGKWVKAIVQKRDQPGMLGRQVYAASAYMTPKDIVEAFKRTFPEAGKTAGFFSVPHEQFLKMLTGTGMPQFAAEELLENMRLMDEGGYFGGKELTHDILDDKPTTWEEYMKKSPVFKDLK
ncbi:NmrA-like family domain-containing protein 1 [Cytospora mali]|uniref:NmrA-like family domain-containing protein 1 n=1 Tax=Cytospora mali TaxID=578113 RepID=A0A194V8Y3_CYTMA|nr:NmrA-like family domain-containing protein 1 [Valsa mali var. pyri (nom. inval.)]